MLGKLKLAIKQCPRLYTLLQDIYLKISPESMRVRLLGTRACEQMWAQRSMQDCDDWGNKGKDWIQGYRDSTKHPHRELLVDEISKYKPKSMLEIGCSCGPNLYLLAKKFPRAKIAGIDINAESIQKGREWFREEGLPNVGLQVGKADDLSAFEDASFDVVFTDATLIYIGPDKINKTIQELLRVAKKGLVLIEQHKAGKPSWQGHWVHDYASLLSGLRVKSKFIKMTRKEWDDKKWAKLGYVIQVTEGTDML